MGRLVVVGCGTVIPQPDRGGSCYYVEMDDSRVLMDCGPGATVALSRLSIPWADLTDVVLTHFHADHIGALPGFFFALRHGLAHPRSAPLHVWGPRGTRELFDRLAAAFGEFMLDPGFPIRLHELLPDDEARMAGGVSIRTHKTPHTDESLAVRLEGEGSSVGYTGDSGPGRTLGPFMRGTEVLVCECSLLDSEVGENHLSPSAVASIAKESRPDILILTHVYPHVLEREDVVGLVRDAGYEAGDVLLAHEGYSLELGPPGLTNR
jgi:ribonuclease BN (tRNA processing enzyme)